MDPVRLGGTLTPTLHLGDFTTGQPHRLRPQVWKCFSVSPWQGSASEPWAETLAFCLWLTSVFQGGCAFNIFTSQGVILSGSATAPMLPVTCRLLPEPPSATPAPHSAMGHAATIHPLPVGSRDSSRGSSWSVCWDSCRWGR